MRLQESATVGQQRKCPDIYTFNAYAVITVLDKFIIAASGKEDIAAYNFFGVILFMILAVVNGITLAVHLIYGISWRIVAAWHIDIFCHILFLKVFVKPFVIDYPIFCIIKICQNNFAR